MGSAARSRTTAGPTDRLGRYAGEDARSKSPEDFSTGATSKSSLIPLRVLYDPSRRDGIGRPIGEDLRMDGDRSGSGCNGRRLFLVNLEDESCWDSQRAAGVQATPLFFTLRTEY
ncbi:hypothetical protein CDV31_005634 [Fusarium ambrosium]|uniref:Uncharacterized protein n=1 Tax=Fusarium ambrosium TaxID=131363 RepID=A0A428UHW3_9HYPO|nr:hypothetical protein CDV31_005634 [Fusarium ambrosium]